MCGILGLYNFKSGFNESLVNRARSASELIEHRGPDDSGEYIYQNVALFHKRLSIIDVSKAGHQPMFDYSGNYVIVYNGEIYNYQELKKILLNKGYNFKSNSDTEVLLNLYIEYGSDCLYMLSGMFAFAIYDIKKNYLFVARDRIGIKPLYYSFFDNVFSFSSSLKSLIHINRDLFDLSEQNIYEYFYLGFVQAPKTVFKNILKLNPGHYIKINSDIKEVSQKKYWDVDNNYKNLEGKNENQIIEELNEIIVDSVISRSVSDVPISILLSGGIDSGLITSILSKKIKNISTFTIGFENKHNENDFLEANITSKYFNTNHKEIVLSYEEVMNNFSSYQNYQEEPNYNPTQILFYVLSHYVKESGIIVTLAGDGGDELFWGYNEWNRYLKLNNSLYSTVNKSPGFIKNILKFSVLNLLPAKPGFDVLRRAADNENIYYGWGAFRKNEINKYFNEDYLNKYENPYSTIEKIYNDFSELKNIKKDIVNWFRYVSLKTYLTEDYMNRGDNMGMANGVEIRVPFLDNKLIEYAFSIPSNLLLRENSTKYLLKKVAEKHLSSEILNRPKTGFSPPVLNWLNSYMNNDFNEKLIDFNNKFQIFDTKFLNRIKEIMNSKRINPSAFWAIYDLISYYYNVRNLNK